MTIVNKSFIESTSKFLVEAAVGSVRSSYPVFNGSVPGGPVYEITHKVNPHTSIGKCEVTLGKNKRLVLTIGFKGKIPEKTSTVNMGTLENNIKSTIIEILNNNEEFELSLTNLLMGLSIEKSVTHFTGNQIHYHTDDDSQVFMVKSPSGEISYALEEAIDVENGITRSLLTTPDQLLERVKVLLNKHLQYGLIPEQQFDLTEG